ncbi:MAG: Gram-pos-anchor domain-containing protein [Lachnoclostridium sp.]|jgi:hypothetical protein
MNILMDQNFNVKVLLKEVVSVPEDKVMSYDGEGMADGMEVMDTGAQVKDPLLSSWPFVIGISALNLAISIVIGLLLARRKIKKGYELYED